MLKRKTIFTLLLPILLSFYFYTNRSTLWGSIITYISKKEHPNFISYGRFINSSTRTKVNGRLSPTTGTLLKPLLISRIIETENHKLAREFIADSLKGLGWDVYIHEAEMDTALGVKTFRNIIATKYPQAKDKIVLSAHYDTNPVLGTTFVGAIDSALPCAMLLDLAIEMNDYLNDKVELSLQLVFFDGEEALQSWSSTDSIYGARLLARDAKLNLVPNFKIEDIKLLVLLDLLGAPRPFFAQLIAKTGKEYKRLRFIEKSLRNEGLLFDDGENEYFRDYQAFNSVEDDHIPFLELGVKVLHIIDYIPYEFMGYAQSLGRREFPSVWHTLNDDENAIDSKTTWNLSILIKVFVFDYIENVNKK
ncbi:hypothetical protein ROZALSC1DRAFT_30256 [Rozella allomycis CSF55]|uniref:Peptide hydrolase n=1 Tax=Rozella allomycis (strain CSF55) TaxID=988480 RepID=A0A075ATJ8_ROZAC|nr:Peptidase M28 domain-containing protein [Rozella allomycis CSF55]RKP17994.1 hypothetical protein ROZALSC1DRAFT_30256 [Rozella allomycis CSF55]|eukprot:EPZ33571.1 Peptidase M28 domain-containing protein [Rozella allomycis CSF55]